MINVSGQNNDRTGMNMGLEAAAQPQLHLSLSIQQETSRQIISSSLSQLPPRLSLLLLLLFYFFFCFLGCQTTPISPLEARFGLFYCFLSDDTATNNKQTRPWKRGGLPLTARWMPQVTSFCFNKIHRGAGFAKAKGRGQTKQLVPIGWANHGTVGTCYFSLFVLLRGVWAVVWTHPTTTLTHTHTHT